MGANTMEKMSSVPCSVTHTESRSFKERSKLFDFKVLKKYYVAIGIFFTFFTFIRWLRTTAIRVGNE